MSDIAPAYIIMLTPVNGGPAEDIGCNTSIFSANQSRRNRLYKLIE
jgi:hypothetical protein